MDSQVTLAGLEVREGILDHNELLGNVERSRDPEVIREPAQIQGSFLDPKNIQTVELFCGTKSFSKIADARGFKTFTVDILGSFRPDLCSDILMVDRADLPDKVGVLWASPPCQAFSVAAIGSSWCGNYHPKRIETALGMAWVLKTLDLIREIKPTYWFIENPRGVLRKMGFMEGLHRNTVTYCQYGDTRMKPTDIWTNLVDWKPRPKCKNGDPCHIAAPRGSKTGTQGLDGAKERSRIPPELFEEIFNVIQDRRSIPGRKEKSKLPAGR